MAPEDLDDGDPLSTATLVYVAPRSGSSGVSDYADDILKEARAALGSVVEVRHGGAGADSVAQVRAGRKAVARAVRAAEGAVIVHTEQSGGVLLPFWSLTLRAVRDERVLRSATLHDAPLGVWLPLRSKGVSRSRLITHALHYPFMAVHRRVERRVFHGVALTALTESGAEAIESELGHDSVRASFLPAPARDAILPAPRRPLAIGLFGYVYKGKGFDQLSRLRELVDPDIDIRVAGRGTLDLPSIDGVTLIGGVEGPDEDRFFESVRAIVLPYSRRSSYGPATHVASSVVARAIAYETPVIALRYLGLADEGEVVDGDIADLARAVNRIVRDADEIGALAARSADLKRRLTAPAAFSVLAGLWRERLRSA
ncbi:hypothetical protein [Microbacterium sp.]|uniref:hypothetical protein n=1 Tax=Microbacterium sp. TaxID=51671 RepID=UPI0025D15410|nr:hypothetical protein [Microbacterium sp.]